MTHKLSLVPNISYPLYFLPPGKPDPKAYLGKGVDQRPRIPQAPQKGGTCLFYAIKRLRLDIGKNYHPDYQQKREIEQKHSLHRKNSTQIDKDIDIDLTINIIEAITNTLNPSPALLKKNRASLYAGVVTIFQSDDPQSKIFKLTEQRLKLMSEHVEEYCEQNSIHNLRDYLEFKSEILHIHLFKKFLENTGVNAEVIYKNALKIIFIGDKFSAIKNQLNREELFTTTHNDLLEKRFKEKFQEELELNSPSSIKFPSVNKAKCITLALCCKNIAYQLNGFKPSQWVPNQTIDILIDDLKTHGPLLVCGDIGAGYYKNSPKVLKEVAGRSIYYWEKGNERIESPGISHAVVVVGAQKGKENNGLVYFVDPNDGSDPGNPALQKIYVHSYQTFKDHVQKTPIIPSTKQNWRQLITSSFNTGYTFYRSTENTLPLCQDNVVLNTTKCSTPIELKELPSSTEVSVEYDTGFGNSLVICGSGGDLSWDPSQGKPLECHGTSSWKMSIPSDVKEFKLVLKTKDGAFTWEKLDGNHSLGSVQFPLKPQF